MSSAVVGTYLLPLEQPRAIPIALLWENVLEDSDLPLKDGKHALETRFFMPGAVAFVRLSRTLEEYPQLGPYESSF